MTVGIERPKKLFVDNKSAINLANNLVSHGRSKHIEARFHFLLEEVNNGRLQVLHCSIGVQVANILIKSLKRDGLRKYKVELGVVNSCT